MSTSSEIIIPISKGKTTLLVVGCLLFVAGGVWMFLKAGTDVSLEGSELFLKIIGVISVLFFGAAFFVGVKKLFQNSPGLILNNEGITDASSGVSVGLIKKEDILKVRKEQVLSTKFLLIDVVEPDEYVEQAKNPAAKRLLKMNLNQYGTPLSINSNTLKIKFEDLENLINNYIEENCK